MAPGRAIVINRLLELKEPRLEDILGALPELYRGRDRHQLLTFLAEHVDGGGDADHMPRSESVDQRDVGGGDGP